MTADFKSKVVLVTGAGSGIGREAALTFARRGGLVYGADLNEKGLTETRSLVLNEGGQCEVMRVDVLAYGKHAQRDCRN